MVQAGCGERIFRFAPGSPLRVLEPDDLQEGSGWVSYTLYIVVPAAVTVTVGRLGTFCFPAGCYLYSGSARKNLRARVNRHLRRKKRLRWHIDYLLAAPGVEIVAVLLSHRSECELVARGGGEVVVSGFGASDCRTGCNSHLRRVGKVAVDFP